MRSQTFRNTPLGMLCTILSLEEQHDGDLVSWLTDARTDWHAVLRVAGDHLVTPSLAGVLQRRSVLDHIEPEACDYLQAIQSLNRMRNETLRTQLAAIAGELNGIGITPLLIKGALALLPGQYLGSADRIMGDLDIVVPEDGITAAQALLFELGYSPEPGAGAWQSTAERRDGHHVPGMQHHSLYRGTVMRQFAAPVTLPI